MNIQYGAKRSIVRPSHTMYVVTVMALIYNMDFDYVTKMRYNKEKDLVCICDVGAYGMVLSSNYNLRPASPEILVKGLKTIVIKKRQKITDLI